MQTPIDEDKIAYLEHDNATKRRVLRGTIDRSTLTHDFVCINRRDGAHRIRRELIQEYRLATGASLDVRHRTSTTHA